ncbi:lipopolysaccharide transport periplasmic protein LptA [Solemya elarraichensis gill symbiont]|uniref:Lipopolysaccharide transport periplasmic protein LptA n=1 Tax=Solemya elarraichensis gill symbiont TaxID=1918949 RepID=A0A1T2LCV8_9GAMM|nr:lipopolysaccharide transport periplasmic protein LptA [Solemya elarraichensis gill symbiont]OOZ42947.1 lipopolysaccharide transport periplasmic protein LptA [Solemya elarraichensis gill symbiont]
MRQLLLTLLTLFSISLAANSVAQQSDGEVEISSNTVEHNGENGTLVYTGNVVVRHTDITINASKLTIAEKDDGGHIVRVSGSPIRFKQAAVDGKSISGEARQGRYDIDLETLVLQQNAKVTQNGNTVSGDTISVNLKTGIATAGNKKSTSSRVRTVIKSGDAKR